jgi:hypothetical protein
VLLCTVSQRHIELVYKNDTAEMTTGTETMDYGLLVRPWSLHGQCRWVLQFTNR